MLRDESSPPVQGKGGEEPIRKLPLPEIFYNPNMMGELQGEQEEDERSSDGEQLRDVSNDILDR